MAPGFPGQATLADATRLLPTSVNKLTYTGCNSDGSVKDDRYLGAGRVAGGDPTSVDAMDDGGLYEATRGGRFYGISQVFQVVALSNDHAPEFSETTATRTVAENTAADRNIGASGQRHGC